MTFKVGDKVKMRNEHLARERDVWQEIGIVIALVDGQTSMKRISVAFPNAEDIRGMDVGQFELA